MKQVVDDAGKDSIRAVQGWRYGYRGGNQRIVIVAVKSLLPQNSRELEVDCQVLNVGVYFDKECLSLPFESELLKLVFKR